MHLSKTLFALSLGLGMTSAVGAFAQSAPAATTTAKDTVAAAPDATHKKLQQTGHKVHAPSEAVVTEKQKPAAAPVMSAAKPAVKVTPVVAPVSKPPSVTAKPEAAKSSK
jgi:hypothetical protein